MLSYLFNLVIGFLVTFSVTLAGITYYERNLPPLCDGRPLNVTFTEYDSIVSNPQLREAYVQDYSQILETLKAYNKAEGTALSANPSIDKSFTFIIPGVDDEVFYVGVDREENTCESGWMPTAFFNQFVKPYTQRFT
jgi:hypothetical protein